MLRKFESTFPTIQEELSQPMFLASLLGQAWPESVTPINVMSGFRKCGIHPLNAGVISDHQMAPSRAFVRPASDLELVSKLDNITPELEKLYQKHHKEGHDLHDPKYSLWLEAKKSNDHSEA